MADRAATAAAVRNIIRTIQGLELENLLLTDLNAIRAAASLKEQELSLEQVVSDVKG